MPLGKLRLRTVTIAVAMFALGCVGHQLLLGRDYGSGVFVVKILA